MHDRIEKKDTSAHEKIKPIARVLPLPAHVWMFIEEEANAKYDGNISRTVDLLVSQARTFQALMKIQQEAA